MGIWALRGFRLQGLGFKGFRGLGFRVKVSEWLGLGIKRTPNSLRAKVQDVRFRVWRLIQVTEWLCFGILIKENGPCASPRRVFSIRRSINSQNLKQHHLNPEP